MASNSSDYSPAQIAQFAYNAGFRGTALAQAVSVAMAESSGNASAKNSIGATGLWQFIPSTWQIYGGKNDPTDPQANANAAYALWLANGQSFSGQWQTWDTGAAQANLPQATAAAGTIKGKSSVGKPIDITASGSLDSGSSVGSGIVGQILKPVFEFAIESGLVLGGVVLMLYGLVVVAKGLA